MGARPMEQGLLRAHMRRLATRHAAMQAGRPFGGGGSHTLQACTLPSLAPAQVGRWTPAILEGCTKLLAGLSKPYKYVVTCAIMQKVGAGLHTAASAYWDATTDGSRTVRRRVGRAGAMDLV